MSDEPAPTVDEEPPTLLTPKEVARLFRVSPKTVHRWAEAGALRCFKTVGGHRRFYREDVEEALRAAGRVPEEDVEDFRREVLRRAGFDIVKRD